MTPSGASRYVAARGPNGRRAIRVGPGTTLGPDFECGWRSDADFIPSSLAQLSFPWRLPARCGTRGISFAYRWTIGTHARDCVSGTQSVRSDQSPGSHLPGELELRFPVWPLPGRKRTRTSAECAAASRQGRRAIRLAATAIKFA